MPSENAPICLTVPSESSIYKKPKQIMNKESIINYLYAMTEWQFSVPCNVPDWFQPMSSEQGRRIPCQQRTVYAGEGPKRWCIHSLNFSGLTARSQDLQRLKQKEDFPGKRKVFHQTWHYSQGLQTAKTGLPAPACPSHHRHTLWYPGQV